LYCKVNYVNMVLFVFVCFDCMISNTWYVIKYLNIGLKTKHVKMNFILFLKLKLKEHVPNLIFQGKKNISILNCSNGVRMLNLVPPISPFNNCYLFFRIFIVRSTIYFLFIRVLGYIERRKKVTCKKRRQKALR
jgi:hypothetical protein